MIRPILEEEFSRFAHEYQRIPDAFVLSQIAYILLRREMIDLMGIDEEDAELVRVQSYRSVPVLVDLDQDELVVTWEEDEEGGIDVYIGDEPDDDDDSHLAWLPVDPGSSLMSVLMMLQEMEDGEEE